MDKNLYDKQTVQVQKKSGFDKSYQNLFTAKVGTIVPIMVDEVIPNTTINLKAAITAQLPPLASDTFMRCKLKYASFFVPSRILMRGYEDWLTGNDSTIVIPKIELPSSSTATEIKNILGVGTLSDYLGCKITESSATQLTGSTISLNALPFLAYHKIYDDWFRNSMIQRSIYLTPKERSAQSDADLRKFTANKIDFNAPSTQRGYVFNPLLSNQNVANSPVFADGTKITDLRQANFDIDMFTAANTKAQDGDAQKVTVSYDDMSMEGEFTISALRAANSIQQFLERNNIAGHRMVDYVKAHYGANLSDGVAQRAVLLGSGGFDVYSKGIYTTTYAPHEAEYNSSNPFAAGAGAQVGSAKIDGSDNLINGFTAQEAGYIVVVAWLSPKVTYGTGISPILTRYTDSTNPTSQRTDMANPILQNVGNEPIPQSLINDKYIKDDYRDRIFGYGDRYYSWKDKVDEVHGLLRDGQSLESFALQRTFTDVNGSTISTDFLKIPTNYLDQVSAVAEDISDYGYWADTYFDYKVSMPLARYSVPSLQDPASEHGESVTVNKNGKQLS